MKEVVAYVVGSHGYSQRRACSLTRQHRSTQRKPSRRNLWLEVRQSMREIAATRVRYGSCCDEKVGHWGAMPSGAYIEKKD